MNQHELSNDAKQGCLDLSAAVLAVFDQLDQHGTAAFGKTETIVLLDIVNKARDQWAQAMRAAVEEHIRSAPQRHRHKT